MSAFPGPFKATAGSPSKAPHVPVSQRAISEQLLAAAGKERSRLIRAIEAAGKARPAARDARIADATHLLFHEYLPAMQALREAGGPAQLELTQAHLETQLRREWEGDERSALALLSQYEAVCDALNPKVATELNTRISSAPATRGAALGEGVA